MVIGLRVVQFRGNRARNFKSASRCALGRFEITLLARLLPKLYSTQSYYHYKSSTAVIHDMITRVLDMIIV